MNPNRTLLSLYAVLAIGTGCALAPSTAIADGSWACA